MNILDFCGSLISSLTRNPIPQGIRNEVDLEQKFLIPAVWNIVRPNCGIRISTHPWNKKRQCAPDCQSAPINGKVEMGCPRCWADSKKWASVAAFGTHHDFDVVGRDSGGKTLAVEAKFVGVQGGRKPNSEIQRLLGQCSLAKTKHHAVIGLCGYRGNADPRWERDTQAVRGWFKRAGIFLIFRHVA